MSTLLMKVHTDSEQCKKECNRKSKIVWSGYQRSSHSLIARRKTNTAKTSNHERKKSMPLPKLFHTTPFFSLFCFLQRSLDSQTFHWCVPIHAMPIGYFRSISAKDNSRPTFLVLDIKDANNHIVHRVHIWILNPTRSKSLRIANTSEDT